MSNGLALATVTSAIRYLLERALAAPHPAPVGGAGVTTVRPDRLATGNLASASGINLFLYQVTPNHAGALMDLPTRRDDGSFLRRPTAALDLHYLLTGYGSDDSLDGQRLLGRAVTALAASPILTRDLITDAVAAYDGDPDTTFLGDADLGDQLELVKLSMTPLPLEELSRLWSVFQQTPYLLSVTYTATVVLLEAAVTTRTALPVQVRTVTVQSSGPPRLESVAPVPAAPDQGPPVVTASTVLVVRGSNLRQSGIAPVTRVRVGPVLLAPEPGGSAAELKLGLTDDVPAGNHSVQVQHQTPEPGPVGPPVRVLAVSNSLPLQVHPTIAVDGVTAADVTFELSPPLFGRQQASIELARLDAVKAEDARTVVIDLEPVPTDGAPQSTVTIARRRVPDGRWLVRARVDGVESVPPLTAGVYAGPLLELS